MIEVTYTDPNNPAELQSSLTWHSGTNEPLPGRILKLSILQRLTSISLEASGHELNLILNTAPGLDPFNPEVRPNVIAWFGDDAKFIIANIL